MNERNKNFKDLLDEAFTLFNKYWLSLMKISAVFFIPLEVLIRYFWDNSPLVRYIVYEHSLIMFRVMDGTLNFLVLLLFLLYMIALLKFVHAADRGMRLSVAASYGQAIKIFGPYIWVTKCSASLEPSVEVVAIECISVYISV